jgi:hypothetical protein
MPNSARLTLFSLRMYFTLQQPHSEVLLSVVSYIAAI